MRRLVPVLLLVLALVAACSDDGGDSDGSGDPEGDTAGSDDTDDGDGAGGGDDAGTGGGAHDGPTVQVSAVGVYLVDAATGEGEPLTFDGVEGADINTDPYATDDAVYFLTYTTVAGQSFSHDAFVTEFDLTTGDQREVAALGRDRESDDATDLTEWESLVVTDSGLFVIEALFGESAKDLVGYDLDSGEETVRVPLEFARDLRTDGEMLYLFTAEGLVSIDPASGEPDVLIEAGSQLSELFPGVDYADAIVTESGDVSDDLVDFFDGLEVSTDHPLAVGDGVLWFQVSENRSVDETGIVEFLVAYDPAAGEVVEVVPTTTFGEYFLEGSISLGDSELAVAGGAVWVIDRQSNGALLRYEPGGGDLELTYEPCESTQDCIDTEFHRSHPGNIWLDVSRLEELPEGGQSGNIYFEHIDLETGELVRSVPVEDLLGF